MLVEDDEVVEDAHHRPLRRDRRFFEDRHAGGAGEPADLEKTARPLCECLIRGTQYKGQRTRCHEHAQISLHSHWPPVQRLGLWKTRCCTIAGPFIELSCKVAPSGAYHISNERHHQPEAGRWWAATREGPEVCRLVWEFFCQVVFWFVPVPCLARKGRSSSRRLRSGSRSARKGVKGPKC